MTANRGVALVTGGGRRVGRAIALALAGRGYDLAIHYNESADGAAAVAERARALGVEARTFRADLSDASAPAQLIEAVADACGSLSVLVNSAANMLRTPFGAVTIDEWEAIFALNLRAPFFLAQAAATHLIDGGVIINIADLAAFETWPGYVPHGISKAGLVQLTRALARTLAPRIRVNAVAPGVVMLPDGWDTLVAERLAATTPLGRNGSAEDVAGAVLYLVEATFVTGEIVRVDGGRHLRK